MEVSTARAMSVLARTFVKFFRRREWIFLKGATISCECIRGCFSPTYSRNHGGSSEGGVW